MTRRHLLIDPEVHAHLPQLPRALQRAFVDLCAELLADPAPAAADPYADIPRAYRLETRDLVVFYTVETPSVSIWRVRVNR
ncbi:ParE-like toxin of type II ParDE toxin-antitoxin system [Murinocardiopsis flavida]|uniref:ParE-like toxin of type II ParDE toxin-antitoxin system n=1 Tax=Murinocardiopsis flavida TaxID=645275 RepID=A0A2P8DP01_9ACTN|nr:type II toxin-antitoxin system RelE/ParE family toxin [Murinocardiopsis flavida]PSK98931.1 ParE-like toxin of type II ParDE toxin-antitoxin system [Murinocardiopsis flavida]